MSRRSPYTSSLPFVRLRASSHRPYIIQSVHGSPYLAIRHAGISHPLRFCSMSRRSPYTSSLPFVRLRASSHRPSVILSVHGSLLTRKKNRLSFRTSGSLNSINCLQSVHSRMRANTPGSRCPLGPALKRHTLISHSALSAAGIIIRITSVG